MLPLLPRDPYVKLKTNLMKVRTYIICLLAAHYGGYEGRALYTLKPSVLDRLFKLKVGNERVSILANLQTITKKNIVEENPFYLSISPEQEKALGHEGELLAGSLAQALAFRHIVRSTAKKEQER